MCEEMGDRHLMNDVVCYSVATTSTKSAAALSEDIQKTLDRLRIHYRPVRGGFECIHSPSINLTSVTSRGGGGFASSETASRRRPSVKRKSSKPAFGGYKPSSIAGAEARNSTANEGLSRDATASMDVPARGELSSDEGPLDTTTFSSPSVAPSGSIAGPSIGSPKGANKEDVDEAWMLEGGRGLSDLVVRFEINVIKVSNALAPIEPLSSPCHADLPFPCSRFPGFLSTAYSSAVQAGMASSIRASRSGS